MNVLSIQLTLALAFGSTALAQETFQLPAVISDGMVLQAKAKVPIWGFAKPGTQVSVKGGWLGSWIAGEVGTADENGRWEVEISTPEAGGPFTIAIGSGGEQVTVKDILLGEVFLCSGQSNMQWELERVIDAAREAGQASKSALALDRPNVRFFTVGRKAVLEPQTDCVGSWRSAKGDDALECSALSYFFACELQDKLGVPIGLLNSSWGGTPVESWTSREIVSLFPDQKTKLERVRASAGSPKGEVLAADRAYWQSVIDAAYWTQNFIDSNFDDSHWSTQSQPALFEGGPIDQNHDGIAWYRKSVDIPDLWIGKELTLSLPAIDDLDGTYFDGRLVGSHTAPGSWNKPRLYRIPAELTATSPAVITVCAFDTGGAGGFGGRQPMELRLGEESIDLSGEWRVREGLSVRAVPKAPGGIALNQNTPSALYAGMIAPLIPYRVNGMLWYQGESNVSRPEEYRMLFPSMIVDWRERFRDEETPFYFVQLAPYDYGGNGAPDRHVAELRDAQAAALQLPATGMALTADIGVRGDIHPKNKWELGRRMMLFAMRDLYGDETVEPEGPTATQAVRAKGAIMVAFSHQAGGLSAPGELTGFEIAGKDGNFVPATATIVPGDPAMIRVLGKGVTEPVWARYLWSDAEEASVFGGTGLPVAPFKIRTPE